MSSCFPRFLVSAWLVAMCNCVAYADFVSPAQVAAVLGYPASKLTMSDLTKESRVRYGSDLLAAYKIESADNSFATMTFIAAKKGLILSPELEAQLKTASSIPPAPGAKPATRRIQFGGDAYGYAGLGGGGPGGSEEMIVATLPSKGIDVQVKMEFPREELDTVPGTEAYHRLLEEGGEQLAQRLIECVKLTVIGAANLRTASNEQPRQSSPTPAATTLAPSVPDQTPKPNASPLVSTPVPQTPAATIEHNTALWPWLVGIATLIVIVMVALKRRA